MSKLICVCARVLFPRQLTATFERCLVYLTLGTCANVGGYDRNQISLVPSKLCSRGPFPLHVFVVLYLDCPLPLPLGLMREGTATQPPSSWPRSWPYRLSTPRRINMSSCQTAADQTTPVVSNLVRGASDGTDEKKPTSYTEISNRGKKLIEIESCLISTGVLPSLAGVQKTSLE
ncbi:hypothetical protein GGR56DRAFT_301223 [Xylariaceae sp. FL0804]|nr:hypothetical protein GGR56DRAFT_301223 [Xylariaceae sp. FL0804]